MNLPEYRRELRRAHEEYADDMRNAGEKLLKTVMALDEQFFEDPSEAKMSEPPRRSVIREMPDR